MTERVENFENELRRAVRSLSSPEPSEALLARILEDRRSGRRIELPAGTPRRHPVIIGIVAAAAAVVLWIAVGPRGGSTEKRGDVVASSTIYEFAIGMGLWPDQLYAQGAATAQLPPIPPRDGSLLREGRWIYSVQTLDEDGRVTTEHPFSVSITKGRYLDFPAWVLTRQRNSSIPSSLIDTVWLSRDSLHPLARFWPLMDGANLRYTLTGDSAVKIWRKPSGDVERLVAVFPTPRLWDRAVVMAPSELGPLFLTTHLASSWQGSFAVTAIGNDGEMVTFWWDLKVIGEEQITVPAGTFDCWKVASRNKSDEDPYYAYWVDKTSGWIVREGVVPTAGYVKVLVSHAAN